MQSSVSSVKVLPQPLWTHLAAMMAAIRVIEVKARELGEMVI